MGPGEEGVKTDQSHVKYLGIALFFEGVGPSFPSKQGYTTHNVKSASHFSRQVKTAMAFPNHEF